nr:MAG TPA: hypothetical protein [Bacteriophage sp.]
MPFGLGFPDFAQIGTRNYFLASQTSSFVYYVFHINIKV